MTVLLLTIDGLVDKTTDAILKHLQSVADCTVTVLPQSCSVDTEDMTGSLGVLLYRLKTITRLLTTTDTKPPPPLLIIATKWYETTFVTKDPCIQDLEAEITHTWLYKHALPIDLHVSVVLDIPPHETLEMLLSSCDSHSKHLGMASIQQLQHELKCASSQLSFFGRTRCLNMKCDPYAQDNPAEAEAVAYNILQIALQILKTSLSPQQQQHSHLSLQPPRQLKPPSLVLPPAPRPFIDGSISSDSTSPSATWPCNNNISTTSEECPSTTFFLRNPEPPMLSFQS